MRLEHITSMSVEDVVVGVAAVAAAVHARVRVLVLLPCWDCSAIARYCMCPMTLAAREALT